MGDSIAESQTWMVASQIVAMALHLLGSLAFLGVVVGVVWKHRRDAAPTLLIGIVLSLLLTCVAPAMTHFVSIYVERAEGMGAFLRVNAVLVVLMSVISLIPQALLIAGVVQLARPARRDVRDPDVRTFER